jgi:hypothetical protein
MVQIDSKNILCYTKGMKVVKLNRRFRQFKEHGHTIALRFDSWNPSTVSAYEKVCRARLQGYGYNRDADWWAGFGHAPDRNSSRPYWITFRNEAELTLVLLSVDLTK